MSHLSFNKGGLVYFLLFLHKFMYFIVKSVDPDQVLKTVAVGLYPKLYQGPSYWTLGILK